MSKPKHHPQHLAIAKQLGTTPGALHALLAIKAGRGSMNRGAWLTGKGLADSGDPNARLGWRLTPAGAELLARARALGF